MNNTLNSNRSFGIVFFIFFLVLSLYPLTKNNPINHYLLLTSIIFLILGLFNSKILTPFNKLWINFGIILGKIISPIVIFAVYVVVVVPTGVILKLFKKDLMSLKINPNLKTYWIEKKQDMSSMDNQF